MTIKETAKFFEKKDLEIPKRNNRSKRVVIVLIIFLFVVVAYVIIGSYIYNSDLERARICQLDICKGEYHGWGYENKNCTCYYFNFPLDGPVDLNKNYNLVPVYSEMIP